LTSDDALRADAAEAEPSPTLGVLDEEQRDIPIVRSF